jgi:toxin CcdB
VRQFDIVENRNPRTRGRYPFAVVLQHDKIDGLATVVVAPLTLSSSTLPLDRLHPTTSLHGITYLVLVEELAAIHRSLLGMTVGSLEAERFAVIGALDRLFTVY